MWQEHEQRQRDWNEVDGENKEVDSRDMVRKRKKRKKMEENGIKEKKMIYKYRLHVEYADEN